MAAKKRNSTTRDERNRQIKAITAVLLDEADWVRARDLRRLLREDHEIAVENKTLQTRLKALLADEAIEARGERAGRQYRLIDLPEPGEQVLEAELEETSEEEDYPELSEAYAEPQRRRGRKSRRLSSGERPVRRSRSPREVKADRQARELDREAGVVHPLGSAPRSHHPRLTDQKIYAELDDKLRAALAAAMEQRDFDASRVLYDMFESWGRLIEEREG